MNFKIKHYFEKDILNILQTAECGEPHRQEKALRPGKNCFPAGKDDTIKCRF
jgi:hypothetical protein